MGEPKSAAGHRAPSSPKIAGFTDLPIREDSAVEVSVNAETGQPEIVSVKPIFRPAEKKSAPVKSHWKWIWIIIILLVVLAWVFLFSYFQTHQAPYSAPIG